MCTLVEKPPVAHLRRQRDLLADGVAYDPLLSNTGIFTSSDVGGASPAPQTLNDSATPRPTCVLGSRASSTEAGQVTPARSRWTGRV